MKALEIIDVVRILLQLPARIRELSKHPYWSVEAIQQYQLRLLRDRLSEAKAHVALYQQPKWPDAREIQSLEDWKQLPLVTKQDLLNAPVEARLNDRYLVNDLIVSKSSGSTGQALDVYYDRPSFYLFVVAGLRLYRMVFNYAPWHRQTYIYTSEYPFNSLLGLYPLQFISTLTPIPETLKRLRENPPHLLVCYPSHLRALVDQMSPEDFKQIRPLAVNVNSEMSSAAERKYLSQKLNTFVFDDYSSEELTRIASQCRHENYHLFEDINYIEILDDQGRPVPEGVVGNIVGSNLHNSAMPLLRYVQGDRGAIRSKPCACGRRFRILEKLEGRKNDSFILPNGKTLSSGFLLDLTYEIFLKYEGLAQAFCLIQERPETWQLEVTRGSQWTQDRAHQMLKDLTQKLNEPSVTLELKEVHQVSRTASGKANPIISRIKRS